MATIVNGSRRRRITAPPTPHQRRPALYVRVSTDSKEPKGLVAIEGTRVVRSVVPDLAMLAAHFGLSDSACVRLAVRLLANAVRAGRFAVRADAWR
jgi:hypothetical protein